MGCYCIDGGLMMNWLELDDDQISSTGGGGGMMMMMMISAMMMMMRMLSPTRHSTYSGPHQSH
jgi:hypothetical protein